MPQADRLPLSYAATTYIWNPVHSLVIPKMSKIISLDMVLIFKVAVKWTNENFKTDLYLYRQ